MLAPDTRQTLLDALRPPPGFQLGCAVGTTFSLNLDVAFTPAAAFALQSVTDQSREQDVEPLELLDSIRRHAGKYTVFFQAGQVAIPAQRRLFAFLEGSLVPVTAPRGGVFHPKVWVLRFDAAGNAPVFRLLCASRNLTHDRAWDTLLRLDSSELDDPSRPFGGSGLSDFVRALPGLAVGGLSDVRAGAIEELAEQIASVTWALPQGISSGAFHPLGLAERASALPFPATADRIAVVSPFLGAGLLKRLPAASGRRVLVSRPDEIASCRRAVTQTFNEVFTLDPDAVTIQDVDQTLPSSSCSAGDPSVPFEGLHAKVFVFDHGHTSTVLVGSANATVAAFGTNVEFITELHGNRSSLGVDALMAEPSREVQTLRSFLVPAAVGGDEAPDDEDSELEDQLDSIRRAVASVPIEVRAVPEQSNGEPGVERYRLAFSTGDTLPPLPDGMSWRCWPITLADAGGAVVGAGQPLAVSFSTSFEAITAFLANEISFEGISTRFVLTGHLVEGPADRGSRLLRVLLGDADRFLRYLLMLLSDDTIEHFGLTDMLDALDRDPAGRWRLADDALPLLEAMLRTLVRDPDRLEQVERLIADLTNGKCDGSDELVPPGLLEVWEPIWEAARAGRS